MNIITDIIFSVTWLLLLVWAVVTMSKGWGAAKKQNDYDPSGMWTTQVTKVVHPEMVGVKPGDQLMGVTFKPNSCDLEEYAELQARINEIKNKLEDDDDGDGDVPALV